MNTIKFRIWNPEEKKMVESGATPMMLHNFFEYTARFNTRYEMPYQQFTGLLDKLGKDIYEGDIVSGTIEETFEDRVCKGIIEIEPMFFMVDFPNDGVKIQFAMLDEDSVEVIGNIYENPELLTN